jgi:hypothetical protein
MRSDLIYLAAVNVPNRFLLCQMVSLWSRKAHQQGLVTGTINNGLQRIACGSLPIDAPPKLDVASQALTDLETGHRVA